MKFVPVSGALHSCRVMSSERKEETEKREKGSRKVNEKIGRTKERKRKLGGINTLEKL